MDKEVIKELEKRTWQFAIDCGMINTTNNRMLWSREFKIAIDADEKLRQPDVIKSVCEHELIKIKNRTVEICKKCGKPWILG